MLHSRRRCATRDGVCSASCAFQGSVSWGCTSRAIRARSPASAAAPAEVNEQRRRNSISERSGYNPGEFCWVDLSTDDVDAAVAFYSDLMGWEAQSAGSVDEAGGYGFFLYKGKMVAGYGPTQSGQQPPAWSGYVAVADADATVARIQEAGGTVLMGPIDLPMDAGRMAVAQDAEGAFVNVLQMGAGSQGAQLVNEVGAWTWNNLSTRDLDKAAKFYGHVFGWRAERTPGAPPDLPYLMWHVEGQHWDEGLAGISVMGADTPPGAPPHWMIYLAVADADEAVEKTSNGGGQVLVPAIRIPVGTMAVLTDPRGASFAILQPDYPEGR